MEAELSIRIIVTDNGQPVADAIVDEPHALLGSAAHCDVRLGPDRVAPEQLMFELRNGAVFAQLRAIRPQVLLNHAPFHNGRMRDDTVLTIGTLEIRATVEQRFHAAKKNSENGVKPTFVASVALLMVLVVLAVFKLTQKPPRPKAPPAPALFADVTPTCPEQEGDAAIPAAFELLAQAESKRERAPFLPEEGLEAVLRFRAAAACFEVAGELAEAKAAQKSANNLQALVERDYHLHQVRLYRAIVSSDFNLLRAETAVLAEYVKNVPGPYGEWLDNLQRDLEVANGEKQKKKNKKKKRS